MNDKNILTVSIINYNHELYIKEALESVLSQKTNFAFSIKVFDDHSTDRSVSIINEYVAKYPKKIEAFFSKKNLGGFGQGNVLRVLASIDTKYFSILDGDDYWCDKNKLQMQIEFLEKNPAIIGCGHNSYLMKNGEIKENDLILSENFKKKSVTSIVDVIEGRMYCHSSSLIYRSSPLDQRGVDSLYNIKKRYSSLGDFFNMIFFAQYGDIAYIDRVMSVYRIHKNGIWSKIKNDEKRMSLNIDAMLLYKNLIDKKYSISFDNAIYHGVKNFLNDLEKTNSNFFRKIKYKMLLKYIDKYESFKTKIICFFVYRVLVMIKI